MTADFIFVHAADLHLGAPFKGIDAGDPRVASALVEATYRALDRLVDLCVDRGAVFLLIAGDVTDQDSPRLKAELRFQEAMRRLAEADVRVFIARGNHDPADRALARLQLPSNVHFFSASEVERVPIEREGALLCTLHGRSYARFDEKGNLAKSFAREPGEEFAIGVLHANVGGNSDFLPYAPCNTGDLASAGMDYWALGHIHKPQTVCTSPLSVYPGSPQGLNPKETGPHGCVAVTVSGGIAEAEHVPLASVEWAQADVDVSTAGSIDEVLAAARAAIDDVRDAADGRDVAVRLSLSGRSEAHAELAAPGAGDDVLAALRTDEMAGTPWAWVDRLADRTSPALDLDVLRASEGLAADAVRSADELLADPAAAAALVDGIAAPLRTSVGGRADIGYDAVDIVARARDRVLDGLLEEPGA
jgi:DNA repair protein SbcD/Mre11